MKFPALAIGLMVFVTMMLESCALPEAPGNLEWDLHATIPLSARTYRVIDLVDSSRSIEDEGWGIGMGSDSILEFVAEQSVNASLNDSLRFDALSRSIRRDIQAIRLPVNDSLQSGLHLSTLNPAVAELHGVTVPELPSHNLLGEYRFELPAGVDCFRVDTGSVRFSLQNTLGYSVSSLAVNARNDRGDSYLLLSEITLAPFQVLDLTASVDNDRYGSSISFSVSAIGDGGTNILVDSTAGLEIETAIGTIQTVPYYGVVFPQHVDKDSLFELDQQHRLFYAVIDSATLSLTAINQSQFDDSMEIVFPDLLSAEGDTLRSRHFVPAHGRNFAQLSLNGYVMRLSDTEPQLIAASLRSLSIQTPERRIFLGEGEYVAGEIELSALYFRYFDGVLNNLEVEIDPDGQSVDRPPTGWEGVRPTDVRAELHIVSQVHVTSDFSVYIASFLSGQEIAQVPIVLEQVQLGIDTLFIIEGLGSLLAEYPDSIAYWGHATANGVVLTDERDTVSLSVKVVAPLAFTLDTVNNIGSVQQIDIEPIEDIQSANALIKVWNRLPLGGTVTMYAARDSLDLSPELPLATFSVAQIVVPTPPLQDHRAAMEQYSEHTVTLAEPFVALLQSPPFFVRVDLFLPASLGDTLVAHASDYITVQVIADAAYRVRTGDY